MEQSDRSLTLKPPTNILKCRDVCNIIQKQSRISACAKKRRMSTSDVEVVKLRKCIYLDNTSAPERKKRSSQLGSWRDRRQNWPCFWTFLVLRCPITGGALWHRWHKLSLSRRKHHWWRSCSLGRTCSGYSDEGDWSCQLLKSECEHINCMESTWYGLHLSYP